MEDLTCCVSGCANPLLVVKRRLCRTHYRRWQRYGDPAQETMTEARAKREVIADHRECSRCLNLKHVSEFHPKFERKKALMRHCKDCHYLLTSQVRRSNPTAALEYKRAYVAKNIEKVRQQDIVRQQRRRLRLASAVVDSNVNTNSLRGVHGDECSYCGIEMAFGSVPRGGDLYMTQATIDHKLPIARGGSHTFDNTVLACRRCNSEKSARTIEEWRAGMRVPKSLRSPASR